MMEFAINISMSKTTKFALFELNSYMLSIFKEIRSDSVIPLGIKDFITQALQNLAASHNTIIEACIF